jgi:carboxyl-terminal processing protease|tara:strand:- start:7875 stop:9479 length:1605 start_codon:yes stop_codon:yes gene_type:complete
MIVGVSSLLIGRSDLYRDISDNWKFVFEVYKRIMTHYAEQIDPKKLAEAGVKGMMAELDPYTVYLEETDNHNLDLLTKGNYGGVGIQLGERDDSLTVISPMDDSPAKRSGILPGDKIIAVDGESTYDMNLDDAASRIRGKRGTKVILTILRYGESENLDFELTRAVITVEDVSFAGIVQDDVGYIRLSRFSKNSPQEVRKALKNLKEQDANKIVLDLRGNSGGLLDAAIRILEMVTDKGDPLLSTSGRNQEAEREFVSQIDPVIDSSIALAILIDGGSASASEIIAGTVQDLDRGIIIGTQSFGKGLVQSIYSIDDDRSLKLTTAKYYIPSGRLIQKPGYVDKEIVIGWTEEDSVFSTMNGRRVTAKGGITPDISVEQMKIPPLTRECWRRGFFFQFSTVYLADHDPVMPVSVDDAMLEEFRQFVDTKKVKLSLKGEKQFTTLEEELDSIAVEDLRIKQSLTVLHNYFDRSKDNLFENEKEYLALGLEREMSSIIGGISARIESSFDDDPVILKTIEVLSDKIAYDNTLNIAEF